MKKALLGVALAIGPLFALTCPAATPEWSFAVFCDCRTYFNEPGGCDGVNFDALHAIAEDAAKQPIRLVVFPGDLVNGSPEFGPLARQLQVWKEAMAPLISKGIPIYVCRGNHDIRQDNPPGASERVWREAFPGLPQNGPKEQVGLSYSVRVENAEFIACEQFKGIRKPENPRVYDSSVNQGMISPWVIDQVQKSTSPWIFVFGHESAFLAHHTDCVANFPKERDELWDSLGAKRGVYLAGHDHLYVRRTAPDASGTPVLELVVGSAGATPYPYDHADLNGAYDRHVIPKVDFVNSVAGPEKNTGGLPAYLGYSVVTVSDAELRGTWRAFVNYDIHRFAGPRYPEQPRFEAFDPFVWTRN